jgi:hypothetical protein
MCGEYTATAYIEQFGSWPEAIDAAGLDQIDEEARERRMYDRIMVLNELVRLTEKFGRVPAYSEVRRHTDFTATTAGNRLGSWPDAEEFARSIADVDTEPESIERTPSSKLRHSGDDRGVERRLDNLDILGELQNELSDM